VFNDIGEARRDPGHFSVGQAGRDKVYQDAFEQRMKSKSNAQARTDFLDKTTIKNVMTQEQQDYKFTQPIWWGDGDGMPKGKKK
jgi:hypothetical protein